MGKLGKHLSSLAIGAAVAVGFGAAPAGFLLLRHSFPVTWPEELPRYQVLAGALVALFAASLGMVGVSLTIRTQRLNVSRQLESQRKEQERARRLTHKQVAAALIGEIAVLVEELQHELVRPVITNALRDIENGSGLVSVSTVRIGGKLPRYFENNPGNVGLFPNPIPEDLTRFYSRFEALVLELNRYSDVAEDFAHALASPQTAVARIPLMTSDQVVYLLRGVLAKIDFCIERGRALIRELETIRDSPID